VRVGEQLFRSSSLSLLPIVGERGERTGLRDLLENGLRPLFLKTTCDGVSP